MIRNRIPYGVINHLSHQIRNANRPEIGEDTPYVLSQDQIVAVITGGSNPYSWRTIRPQEQGHYNALTEAQGKQSGSITGQDCSTGDTRPAYEINDNKNVLPGTIVLLTPFFQTDSTVSLEYSFLYCPDKIAAQVFSEGAPTKTLNGGITATATSLITSSPTGFPARNNFFIKIDDEYMQVTAGAGTTNLTVTRGANNSVPSPHSNGADVILAGQYSWKEVKAVQTDVDRWEDRPCGRGDAGDWLYEPAVERNNNCLVPNETFVWLQKKTADGAGATTSVGDITAAATSIVLTSVASFPSPTSANYYIRVESEYMRVTGRSSNTLTVTRGVYGSEAVQHESGSVVVEAICEWVFDYCCTPPNDVILYWTADEDGSHTNTSADDDFLYSSVAISKFKDLPNSVDYTQFTGSIRAKDLSGRNPNMMEGARYHGVYQGIIVVSTVEYHLYTFTAIPGIGFVLASDGGKDIVSDGGPIDDWTIEADPYNLVTLDMAGNINIQNDRFYGWWHYGTTVNFDALIADQLTGTDTYNLGGGGSCDPGCFIQIPYDFWYTRAASREVVLFPGPSVPAGPIGQQAVPYTQVNSTDMVTTPSMAGTQGCITLGMCGYAESFSVDVGAGADTGVAEDFTGLSFFWASRIGDAPP